jgi:hypothetical protein
MLKPTETNFGTLKPFADWLRECGWSKSYGWRMRKRGMVQVVNIAGKFYVSAQAVQDFLARAEAGQFSKAPQIPSAPARIASKAATGV